MSKEFSQAVREIADEDDEDLSATPSSSENSNSTSNNDFSNLSWLDDIVSELERNKATIASLHSTELVSIFFLSNTNLKNSLLPAPERCLALLNTELPPFFASYANSILEQLSSSHHDISSACYTVHDYVLQLEAVSAIENVYEHVDKEASKVRKVRMGSRKKRSTADTTATI
jgi:hypothetical protein